MESIDSGAPFLDFFFALRDERVGVGPQNWLALMHALQLDLHGVSIQGFYDVARSIVVSHERELAGFDRAFLRTFGGDAADMRAAMHDDLLAWLADPIAMRKLDPAMLAALKELDLETLRKEFEDRLRTQTERHDGGSHWIGTGGRSPFGQGGVHPSGIRIGGMGGGRSALAVADPRRYEAFESDRTLDTRQLGAALRRLRKLGNVGEKTELDLDRSVHESARMAGELEIVWKAPRKNTRRLLLLLDVGGSMDPHADLVSRLFSAAHRGGGFRELRSYYFHNCVYRNVFEDAELSRAMGVDELLRSLDGDWVLIFVGDAWMHPAELTMSSGDFWDPNPGPSGIEWLAMLAQRVSHHAWLNPEPERFWGSDSIATVRRILPMYRLSVDGLSKMTDDLRRSRQSPGAREREPIVSQLAREGRMKLTRRRDTLK